MHNAKFTENARVSATRTSIQRTVVTCYAASSKQPFVVVALVTVTEARKFRLAVKNTRKRLFGTVYRSCHLSHSLGSIKKFSIEPFNVSNEGIRLIEIDNTSLFFELVTRRLVLGEE